MSGSVSYIDSVSVDYDYLFKVLLIGNSSVGKTSLVERFCENTYDPNFVSTIGVDFKIRSFHYNDKVIKLQIWDTAGQERFRSITTSYYRGANGIIMVHDLTDSTTLKDVEKIWLREIERYATPEANLLLLGNKSDLAATKPGAVENSRKVAKEILDVVPEKRVVGAIETSAKTGTNVEEAFLKLVEAMMQQFNEKNLQKKETQTLIGNSLSLGVGTGQNEEKSCFCA